VMQSELLPTNTCRCDNQAAREQGRYKWNRKRDLTTEKRLSKPWVCCTGAGWLMLLWHSGTLSKMFDTCHCQGEQKFDGQQEDVSWRIFFVALRRSTVHRCLVACNQPSILKPTPIGRHAKPNKGSLANRHDADVTGPWEPTRRTPRDATRR
jgi:hypothetical protein